MTHRPDSFPPTIQAVLLALLLGAASAAADIGNYLGHELSDGRLVITAERGELELVALDDGAMAAHYRETGIRQLPSFAIADDTRTVPLEVSVGDDALEVRVQDLTGIVSTSPVSIAWFYRGRPLVAEETGYFAYDTLRGFRFRLDAGEKILGGGERVLGMDRRGRRMPLYNKASYGYETEAGQMYYSLPAVMSSKKYMLVFDNSASGTLDIGHYEPDVLQFEAVGGRTSYIVVAGDSYEALIGNYTDVTGRQPLPPRWLFGNFASRYGYRSEKEVRDVVARFRREDIPLDTVVVDLFWFGPDEKGHMGNLDWDRTGFPNGEKMIADLAEDGINTLLITEPFVLTTSTSWNDAVAAGALAVNPAGEAKTFDFFFGETGLVDVWSDAGRDWFWQTYRRLFEQGVAGTWGDLGEPEVHPADALHALDDAGLVATADEVHNAYGHQWARFVYERQRAEFPGMRPAILMRSGFAGTQRYGIVPWTGDVNRSWGGLEPQIELALQMGVFGLGYTHSDLGGFAGGEAFDRELYVRWLQYGVFQPVFRPHAQDHIPPEPVFHDETTIDLARQAIRLRYRLLPYNYTLAWENSTTGMPLMRPLFFENEEDTDLIDVRDRYLWGDAFLVAPVRAPGLDSLTVSLPDGVWFDFQTGDRHVGGVDVQVPLSADHIPVFVRAGAFVPMLAEDIETTANYSSATLELHYFSDPVIARSTGRMYEDDGVSPTALGEGKFELLGFSASQSGDQLGIGLKREGGGYAGMPAERTVTLVVHNWLGEVTSVRIGDDDLPIRRRPPARGQGAGWDRSSREIRVRIEWDHAPTDLRIN